MSLLATRMQEMRVKSNLDKNELRPSRYGGLNLFARQTDDPTGIITPELEEASENSIGRDLKTPVIDYDGTVTIGDSRSVTIPDSENTSQMHKITFATYSWGFTIVPAMFMNNEIKMQRDFERKFNKYLYAFAKGLDEAAIAELESNKTQVFEDVLNYTKTGNVLEANWDDRELIIGDINPMLAANDHFDQIHLVGNAGVESVIRKLAQRDLYNDEMKTMEYSDKELHFTNNIGNSGENFANMYAVNGGSLGILKRFERESVLGTTMADGTAWGIENLPMIDFPVGTYFYESKGDFKDIGGASTSDMTRAKKEHYGFAVDVAFVTPYNSDPATIANPIMKISIDKKADPLP